MGEILRGVFEAYYFCDVWLRTITASKGAIFDNHKIVYVVRK